MKSWKGNKLALVVAILVGLPVLVSACTKPPVASFTADKTIAAVGEAIRLTDNSTGEITSWSWDLGDGNTSTEQNPSHTYTIKGNYIASLTVSNKAGSNTATLGITVLEPPMASLAADKAKAAVREPIEFTNTSTGDITSWSWDFGDGNTSTEENPSHSYAKQGDYTASLTVSSEVGSDTDTSDIIVVGPPSASFSTSETKTKPGSSIQFTDESTGDVDSWSWDFGDGNTSTKENPSHTYAEKGDYTVSLTVSNMAGSDTDTLAIVVLEPPKANFSASETKAKVNSSIQFTDESTGDIDSWSWDFGDGDTSTEENPSHTYRDGGTYTVSLKVSNAVSSDTREEKDYITISSFIISRMVMCSDVTGINVYTPQPDATFHVGDSAWLYFEVTGFEQRKTNGEYEVWIQWQGHKIYDPDGNLIWDESDTLSEGRETLTEMWVSPVWAFWWPMGVAERTDPLGEYRMEVKMVDKSTGETATESVTFILE